MAGGVVLLADDGLLSLNFGQLTGELVDISGRSRDVAVDVTFLSMSWFSDQKKFARDVKNKSHAALLSQGEVAVVFGELITSSELDPHLKSLSVSSNIVAYCHKFFLGKPVFENEIINSQETFFHTGCSAWYPKRIVDQCIVM